MRRSGVGRSAATVPRGGSTGKSLLLLRFPCLVELCKGFGRWPARSRGAPGGLTPCCEGFRVMFATASPSVVEGCLLGGGVAQELAPELAPEVRGLWGDGLVRLRPA